LKLNFSNKIQKGKACYSEEQVINMLEFLIDSIFASFGGILFQQVVGIPMGTNCAPLLAARLSLILVLIRPLSSNSRYKSKNGADEAVSVVSLTSSSGVYINGRNSANLELILFQQVVGIPMGTNCAPLLADLFLYSYESEFLQKLVKDKKIHEARAFNFTQFVPIGMPMTC
jgi:hypothetical protein